MTKKRQAATAKAKAKSKKKRGGGEKLPRRVRSSKTTERLDWQGIIVSVTYDPDWLGVSARMPDAQRAHLEVQKVSPDWALLPISETGYRSQFLPPGIVEKMGGPRAYVRAWLDEAAKDPGWKRKEVASRQLSLF